MVRIKIQDLVLDHIEAIIFDKDGTLEDSSSFWRDVAVCRASLIDAQVPGMFNSLLEILGIENNQLNPSGLMATGSREDNLVAIAQEIVTWGYSWQQAQAMTEQAFRLASIKIEQQASSRPLFPQVKTRIKSFAKSGLKLGIISADSTLGVETFVSQHKLSDYLQIFVGSDRGLKKPDPKLFRSTCHQIGVKPHQAVMVGDAALDIEMSRAAQAAASIGINWQQSAFDSLINADRVIVNLNEITILPPRN